MLFTFLVVLLTIGHTANASIFNYRVRNDLNEFSCSKHCFDDKNHQDIGHLSYIEFEKGKTYVYDLKVSNQILATVRHNRSNENGDQVGENLINIDGEARLKTLNHCDVSLELDKIQINFKDSYNQTGDQEVERFVQHLRKPIIFSYKDGIVTKVCSPDRPSEEELVINVKKSIISSLQTMANIFGEVDQEEKSIKKNVVETDYHGDCETEYHVYHEGIEKYTVSKQKDLLKCTNQEQPSDSLLPDYLSEENSQAFSKCQQVVESKHIVKSECHSQHVLDTLLENFRIELTSKVYLRERTILNDPDQNQLNSIFSGHKGWLNDVFGLQKTPFNAGKQKSLKNNEDAVLEDTLNQICQDIKQNFNRISLKTTEYIQTLTHIFQSISRENVQNVWKQTISPEKFCKEQSKKIKDLFVNVAAFTMNENTAPIVHDEILKLYDQRQDSMVSERLQHLATSMAFAQNPSKEAVEQIVPDLLQKVDDSGILLSISAMVKKSHLNKKARNDLRFLEQVYKIIIEKLLTLINANTESYSQVDAVRLLKSLENVASSTPIQDQEKLLRIINGQSVSGEWVRSTSIKSLEAVQPTSKIRLELMKIFQDDKESNEIRIVAYRTLVNTGTNVREMNEVLTTIQKESNSNRDVFNYVCSHQKVLRTTSAKYKKSILPLDSPQFPEPASMVEINLSRHYEYSWINSNLGTIVQTDVIMSNKSGVWSIPRFISFNWTLPLENVQDQPISVAEVTIRQEGFEGTIGAEVLRNVPKLFTQPKKSSRIILNQLSNILDQEKGKQKFQLLVNLDGKNIFVFDSQDQQSRLIDIYNWIKQKFPIHIDETRVLIPYQRRFEIKKTDSGVPMYFEINTTYIGSLEVFSLNQKQQKTQEDLMEIMLKPTIVAQTNLEFGSYMASPISITEQNEKRGFRIVNQVLMTPTIHLKTKFQGTQVKVELMLPEQEQTWWRSVTKIIRGQNDSELKSINAVTNEQQKDFEMKCSNLMMKYLGVSLCLKNKKPKSFVVNEETNEIIPYYSEIVLRKQDSKIEGLEIQLELPEAILRPIIIPKENELKFGISLSTLQQPENVPKFQTYVTVRLPNELQEQLTIDFTVGVQRKLYDGRFTLIDKLQQKLIKLEINNQGNAQVLRIKIDGQINSTQKSKDLNLNYNIDIQPFEGSSVYSSRGMLVYRKSEQNPGNLNIKFEINGKKILDVQMLQQQKSEDYQISLKSKLEIVDIKIQHRWLFSWDENEIKFASQTRYNRFWSRKNSNHSETFDFDYQSSLFDQSELDHSQKRFFRLEIFSSQYSTVNLKFLYNNKLQSLSGSSQTELSLKYGRDFEQNQLKVEQVIRPIKNNYGSDTKKYEIVINFDFNPRNLHYTINGTVDSVKEGQKIPQQMTFTVRDRVSSQIIVENSFQLLEFDIKPFKMEITAEAKFLKSGNSIFLKNRIHEDKQGMYLGKLELVSVIKTSEPRWLPKQSQVQYKFQTQTQQEVQDLIDALEQMKKFEHQMFLENDFYGHCGHMGAFEISDDRQNYRLKAMMRREGEQVYDTSVEYDKAGVLKLLLDTIRLDHLKFSTDFDWKDTIFKGLIDIENLKYRHQTLLETNGETFQVSSETTKQNQTLLTLKSEMAKDKKFVLRTISKVLNINVETKNLLEWRNKNQYDPIYAVVEFQLPMVSIEHGMKIRVDQTGYNLLKEKSVEFETRTYYRERSVLNFILKCQSNSRKLQGEFGGDLKGQLEIKNLDAETYQLNVDIHAPKQQIMHQTIAEWQVKKNLILLNSYRLKSFDIKNYFGDRKMLDIHYRNHKDEDQYQYGHQLTVSTTSSYGELSWSELKAMLVFKTKLMGGIDHQTDFQDINLPKLKLISKTLHKNNKLLTVVADLTLKNGQKSSIDISLGEDQHNVQLELVEDKIQVLYRSKNEWKFLRLNGLRDSNAVTYNLEYETFSGTKKIIKLEWDKPKRKLQINVYDQNGRIIDINVDILANALRRKIQVVSNVDYIPTIDVEAVFGENKYLVFAVSFAQEKKMELSLNWFGQWRSNYRFQVLFKCYSKPQVEAQIISHHPETFDRVDAVIKYNKREIKVKYNNRFDDRLQSRGWKSDAIIEIDGRKSVYFNVDCIKRQDPQSPNQEVIYYNGELDGDHRILVKAEIVVSKQPEERFKMIRIEIKNPPLSKHYLIELFKRYQEDPNSPPISGIQVEQDQGKPIFIATYVEPPPSMYNSSKVNTLAHLLLPGGVDYQLKNEITYHNNQIRLKRIRQIKSQLRKKGENTSIAFFKIYQNEEQSKTLRLEIESPKFFGAKVMKLQWAFEGPISQCRKSSKILKQITNGKCSNLQLILGDEQLSNLNPVSLVLEYIKFDQLNRTILFSLETLNESNMNQALNFTTISHISSETIGYQWDNINRYGNHRSGQFFVGLVSKDKQNQTKTLDFIYRNDNKQKSEDDVDYQIHVDPEDIVKSSFIHVNLWKIFEKILWRTYRIEEYSDRTDLCEWHNRIIREIKEETQFKWRLFKKQTVDQDLIKVIIEEIDSIRSQMKFSQDDIANKLIGIIDKLFSQIKHLFDGIDLEKIIDEIFSRLHKTIERIKYKMFRMAQTECFQYEQCKKLYHKVFDYEMKRLLRRSLMEYIPQCIMKALNEIQIESKPKSELFIDQIKYLYNRVCYGDAKEFIYNFFHMILNDSDEKNDLQQKQQQSIKWSSSAEKFHDSKDTNVIATNMHQNESFDELYKEEKPNNHSDHIGQLRIGKKQYKQDIPFGINQKHNSIHPDLVS